MIIAIIPAKADSRRMPNKNMALLLGKPLIYYSIENAKESELIDKIYVSTDSDEIAEYARSQGVGVIRRGSDLGGEVPLIDVYYQALSQIKDDAAYIVGLQPDHPDRTANIDEAIRFAIEKKYQDMFTVDSCGKRNGSIRIMKVDALKDKKIYVNVGSFLDDCTNIHTLGDLNIAKSNLEKKK